jgi:uncharacterized membrane protein
MHAGKGRPNWTWAVTVVIFIVIAWLSTLGGTESYDEAAERPMTEFEMRFASADGFEDAYNAVQGNCSMCHAREPLWDGIRWAPKGVYLETEADVARHAQQIYLQAGRSHAMPPPNAIQMDTEQRAQIVAWFRAAQDG